MGGWEEVLGTEWNVPYTSFHPSTWKEAGGRETWARVQAAGITQDPPRRQLSQLYCAALPPHSFYDLDEQLRTSAAHLSMESGGRVKQRPLLPLFHSSGIGGHCRSSPACPGPIWSTQGGTDCTGQVCTRIQVAYSSQHGLFCMHPPVHQCHPGGM